MATNEWIGNTNLLVYIIKFVIIAFCTYITSIKLLGTKINKKEIIILSIGIFITAIICSILKMTVDYSNIIICLIFSLSVIFSKLTKSGMGYSIMINGLSLSINYFIYLISLIIDFILYKVIKISSEYINFIIIFTIYIILLNIILKFKKIKYGINFIKGNTNNNFFDILILNISMIILFFFITFINLDTQFRVNTFIALMIFFIIMFITIQKSLQLYYKQKLQQKELEETKEELEKAKKEITELEQENLNFSKKSHSIAHKQKALEYKLNQLLLKNEIAEELDIKDKLKEISKQIQNEDTTIELTKTNIEEIDDMLK